MSLLIPALKFSYADNDSFVLNTPEIRISNEGYACIIGLNGSGKSSYGEVLARSRSLPGHPKWQYLPQYLDRFLFAENIIDQLSDLLGQDINTAALIQVMGELGFHDPESMLEFPFMLMSGGERRRMALTTVFYVNPKYIILDEPEIGITLKENMVLLSKINNLQATASKVILISHNAGFVQGASDLICLKDGSIDRVGSTQSLMNDPDFHLQEYGVRFYEETGRLGIE